MRRRSQLLELTSGFLAARAIAGGGQNRRTGCLELYFAALARWKKLFVLLVHWIPILSGPDGANL